MVDGRLGWWVGVVNDPFAQVHYGYATELYTSPRYAALRRGTRYAVLQHVLGHFGEALADGQGELPEEGPSLIRRFRGPTKCSVWREVSWPAGNEVIDGTGVVSETPETGVESRRLASRRGRATRREPAGDEPRARSRSAVVLPVRFEGEEAEKETWAAHTRVVKKIIIMWPIPRRDTRHDPRGAGCGETHTLRQVMHTPQRSQRAARDICRAECSFA